MIDHDSHPDYFDDQETADPATEARHIDFGPSAEQPAADPADPAKPTAPKPRHRLRRVLTWIIALAIVALGVTVYFRYFSPYVSDAQMRCYVINVEKRGIIFKTYEADVVSEHAVADTTRLYSREQSLSVESPAIAHQLRQWQGTGRPVTISYKTYWASIPWRGASKSVVTAVE